MFKRTTHLHVQGKEKKGKKAKAAAVETPLYESQTAFVRQPRDIYMII
jgi:hypothetical protein